MHGRSLRPLTIASLQCREAAHRVITDQADIACTMRRRGGEGAGGSYISGVPTQSERRNDRQRGAVAPPPLQTLASFSKLASPRAM